MAVLASFHHVRDSLESFVGSFYFYSTVENTILMVQANIDITSRCRGWRNSRKFDKTILLLSHPASSGLRYPRALALILRMRIPLSSNLVSGAHVCLELALTVLLTFSIKLFLGGWHLKRLYHDKSSLRLSSSRLHFMPDYGITTNFMHWLFSSVTLVVLVLLAISGFAFAGITGQVYDEVPVKHLVTVADSNDEVDFSKHISLDTGLVSGTYLLLAEHRRCISPLRIGSYFYQYYPVTNVEDLEEPLLFEGTYFNVTCVRKDNEFNPSKPLVFKAMKDFFYTREQCKGALDEGEMPSRQVIQRNVTMGAQCPMQIKEAWCLRNVFINCALRVLYPDGTHTAALLTFATDWTWYRSSNMVMDQRLKSSNLKSMLFLASLGDVPMHPTLSVIMTFLKVEENAFVERKVRDRNETEVNVLLLALTLGPAVVLFFLVTVVALFMWIKFVYHTGRSKYNRFNSATDMLSCAAAIAFNDTAIKYQLSDFMFGVSRAFPHVGPVKNACNGRAMENYLDGEKTFLEEELE